MKEINYKNETTDITEICIDTSKSIDERINSYVSQVGNPYCIKMGGTLVSMSYQDSAKPLSKLLAELSF